MKMTRILASLLCIMMIVCALPMMASAAGSQVPPASAPFNLGAAVADVMNEINGNEAYTWARPTNDDDVVNWAPLNIDFTADGMEGLEYSTEALDGVTFDSENGMTFPETEGAWRYFPAAENKCGNTSYWGPGSDSGYYAYSFKVQEGGKLMSWGAIPWTYNVAHITATPTSVTIKSSNGEGSGVNDDALVTYTEAGTAYAPGTEWNDVLVHVVSAKTPYQVWMKKSGDTTFTKIAEAQFPANVNGNGGSGNLNWGFGNDYTTTKKGLTFVGTSASVGYAANYKGVNLSVYQSIDDILGQETGSTYSFEFDENTNFTNSTGRIGFTATGYKSEADGLTLVDPADSSNRFKFAPFGNYSPLNGTTNWNDQTYEPQALYIKAKGGFNLLIPAPKIYGRIEMVVVPGSEISIATSNAKESYPLVIQDEWTEYLIVPNDMANDGWYCPNGYCLYVKGDRATGGYWYKVKDYGFANPTSGYSSYGLSVYKVTGHIKSMKTLALSQSVSNATATPAGANYLYYNEEFDATPAYPNLTTGGKVDGNGNLLFATTKSSMDYNVNGLEIPVGGYAEFKAQYDGIVKYDFYDGEKMIGISQQSDYGTVTGSTGYCGNNNTSWATWRIVRAENGYNIYSRNEGDNGWVQHAVGTGVANTKAAAVKMNFGTRNGSTEGNILTGDSKMAYLKVYGPAPTSALTVTDGYTATPVASGATLAYPASLRAIATPDSGKLLVVSYKGNDMAKAQIVNVADMVNDSVFVDATEDGADSVKVFLWDGFSGLNRLAPVVTLGL